MQSRVKTVCKNESAKIDSQQILHTKNLKLGILVLSEA